MKKLVWIAAVCAALLATACRKECRCLAYNGSEHTYSREEVDSFGRSCSDMRYMYTEGAAYADVRFYSVCNWE